MLLISGLGNPGGKYLMSRHNIGFIVIDALSKILNTSPFKKEKNCLVAKVKTLNKPFLLVKPQQFMNLSGQTLLSLIQFYRISKTKDLLVIHDDIDQEWTSFRYQKNRGHGGHNGVRNIQETLKTKDFFRLKIGVSRPPASHQTANYVLENFSKDEQKILPKLISLVCESLICFIEKGYTTTINEFNQKNKVPLS